MLEQNEINRKINSYSENVIIVKPAALNNSLVDKSWYIKKTTSCPTAVVGKVQTTATTLNLARITREILGVLIILVLDCLQAIPIADEIRQIHLTPFLNDRSLMGWSWIRLKAKTVFSRKPLKRKILLVFLVITFPFADIAPQSYSGEAFLYRSTACIWWNR